MSKLSYFRTRTGREPVPPHDSGVPPLSKWERWGASATALGGVAVGGLGFYASFDAVAAKAETWGFESPWVLPAAIDSAIPVFTGANLFLIRMGMPLGWVRFVPWVLSLITCALNVATGETLWAKVAHGSMSLLWVAVSEIAAHIYAVRIGAATGRKRMEKVRWSRWLLSPAPTFLLWRRMKLWELTSYEQVLGLEQDRLIYVAQLKGEFGRNWRRKAPVASLIPLRLARTGIPLQETGPAGLAAAGIDPAGAFEQPVTTGTPPLSVPSASPAAVEPEAPKPAAQVSAAAQRPRTVTATVPAQKPKVTAEPAELEVPAEVPAGEVDSEPVSENALYDVVVAALEAGESERFSQGGDLTGAGMARLLKQSAGNGRKVRIRLLTRYAAHLSEQGAAVPENFTVEDLMTTASV
ncbi:DUF2637 domain-containing protein [[Kitasatospora] papulosa]|uniref:DUF2637 domain-containing protein n=1 Tax=[Kitasatospora] papulosa TaxID=1464011 RepID=UPI0039080283